MKKKLTFLLISMVLFTACSANANQADTSSYSAMKSKNQYRTGDYEVITKDMVDLKEGIYVVAHPGLNTSLAIIPALNDVLKSNKLEAYYIDMNRDEDFTTNVNRRIVEFDQTLESKLQSGDHRPFIVSINDKGEVRTFHAGKVELDFKENKLSESDIKLLKESIKLNLFE